MIFLFLLTPCDFIMPSLTISSCLPSLFLILHSMHFPYAATAAPTVQHMFPIPLPYVILPFTMTVPHYL